MTIYSVPVDVAADNAVLSCPSVIHPCEEVAVSFSGAPINDSGVYVVMTLANAPDNYEAVSQRLEMIYLEGKTSGVIRFVAPWTPGEYKFLMFVNRETVHVVSSGIMKVEQYKAVLNVSPESPIQGSKVTVKYTGIPTRCGTVYIVTMRTDSKSTPEAISNERLDLVELDADKTNGTVVLAAPLVPGKYNFRIVINRDTVIIGSSDEVQVRTAKALLAASPAKCKKNSKVAVTFSNAPTDMGPVYIVMMRKTSASSSTAVTKERLALKYISGKSGKVVFTAPNKAGSYNFRMFVNKGTVLKGTSNVIEVF